MPVVTMAARGPLVPESECLEQPFQVTKAQRLAGNLRSFSYSSDGFGTGPPAADYLIPP